LVTFYQGKQCRNQIPPPTSKAMVKMLMEELVDVKKICQGFNVRGVLPATAANFNQVRAQQPYLLVVYYTDYCFGYCQILKIQFAKASLMLKKQKDLVRLAAVNVNADSDTQTMVNKYRLQGYPSMLWFSRDATDPKKFIEPVDRSLSFKAERIVDFVTSKLDYSNKSVTPTGTKILKRWPKFMDPVVKLTERNFAQNIIDRDYALILWCDMGI